VKNAFQQMFGGGFGDMFVAKIAPDTLPPPQFTATPSVLPFSYINGSSAPSTQTISVTSTMPGQVFTATTDTKWLAVSSTSTAAPATLTVSINPTGLIAGLYTGTIRIDPQTAIQVNLTVLNAAPIVTLVSPASIPLGSNDTTVTVTGSGFVNGAVVQFSVGNASLPTTFVDARTLQAVISKGLAATPAVYTLVVANPQSAPSAPFQVTIGTPPPLLQAVANAASFTTGPVAPGEIVSIFGTNLANAVAFDGAPATLVYFSPTQVNVTVPYSVIGPRTLLQMGPTSVQLQVAPSAPGIFAAVPAGGIVTLYGTGCGGLTQDALPLCSLPSSITVNGETAQVLYAGIAPGLVSGANQINFALPDIQSGPISIVWTVGHSSSQSFSFTLP
jgi:uncharacterized protein (TIGR03437 family)